jgi:hypothetical protein
MKFIIAHISKPSSKNNNSYNNYYIEKCKINITQNMKWDDNKNNTLSIGDYLLFYCWGERVEIHKIINTTDYTTRPLHWDINNCNVLHLSVCLKTYSFQQFSIYEPPYSVYKQGFKKKNVYQLSSFPKLQFELNKHMGAKNYSTTAPSKSEIPNEQPINLVQLVLTETEEERELREEEESKAKLAKIAKARAMRKAEVEIIPLRQAKAESYKAKARRKKADIERLIKEAEQAEAEAEAILKGERDETITQAEAEKNGVIHVVVGGNAPKHPTF